MTKIKAFVVALAIAVLAALTVGLPAQAAPKPDWWTTRPSFWICMYIDNPSNVYIIVKFQRANGTTYLDNLYRDECTDDQTWDKPLTFRVPGHETCVSQFGGRYVGDNTWSTSALRNGFYLECYKW